MTNNKRSNVGLRAGKLHTLAAKLSLTGRKQLKRRNLIPVAILAAIVGSYLIYHSLAAGPYTSQEAETTNLNAPAAGVVDATASGGSALAFGTTSGITACPSATPIPIQVSDNPQTIVSAHPAGSVYLIKAGVHNGFTFSPKTGDTYCGEPGAILEGGNTTRFAFDANGAANVTIIGASNQALLEIRNYHSGSDDTDFQAPIHDNSVGEDNWLIRYVDVHHNYPSGINVNVGTQVRDSKIHDNFTLAISAYKASNIVIDHNEMYNNDSSMTVSCDNEAGAIKMNVSYQITYNNNYIHDNGCDGLWNDGGMTIPNPNATFLQYTNNILIHNGGLGKGSGIHHEISGGPCTITGNYLNNNNFDGNPATISAGQIFISNSFGCEIANNTIVGAKGVVFGDYDRSADCTATQCPINNENVHDNSFYFNGTGIMAGGSCYPSSLCTIMTNGTNHWQNNHYHMPNTSAAVFSWPNTLITKTQWQALGFDTTGTFDNNTAAPAQPAWSLAYGSASSTISVPTSSSYVVWSRMMAADASSQSYGLSLDNGALISVGGSGLTPNSWTWVKYQNGNPSSPITVSLSAGDHSLALIGVKPGVKVDRVLMLSDSSCVPSGTGDNCAVNNTPPSVTVSATPTTLTQGQVMTLSSTASDNAGSTITKVDFFDGSTLVGTDTTSPYSMTWQTNASTSTGVHTMTAKATDAVNLTATSAPVSVTINPATTDTTPPSIALYAPVNNATVFGSTVTLNASASDNTQVASVSFSIDGQPIGGPITTAPYTLTWDSTTVTNGPHIILATATDAAGNQAADGNAITVSNTPPADTTLPNVSLTAPTAGAIVSGANVALAATASDNVAVANVTFRVDGVVIGATDTTSPYEATWNTTGASNGSHTVMATATDSSGNTNSSQYAVTVQNGDTTPPSTPTNLTATAAAYNKINLSWTASTDNVGVSGYYVVRNGVTIAQLASVTSYSDTTVTANTAYSYYVFARDAAGNTSANSNTSSVTTPAAPTAPSAPTNLTATPASSSQINLAWTASNGGPTTYKIYRKVSTSSYSLVASLPAASTSYGDTGLSASTNYSYYVVATNSIGSSPQSNTASAATQAPQTGIIQGYVYDGNAGNAPLSGATVSLSFGGSTHKYTTNSAGFYRATAVPVGSYSVQYASKRKTTITLTLTVVANQTTLKNVTLTR